MAKLKGICKNIDGCDLAADKIEQEAEKSNFICSECGKPLTQVGKVGGGKGPNGGDSNKKLLIIVIAIVIVIGGGAGAWFGGLFGGSSEPQDIPVDTTVVDPIVPVETDSAKVVVDSVKPEPKNPQPEGPVTDPQPVGPKFSWGRYSGPASGFGGELKVTRQHSIDLGNTSGEVIDVYPGDVIKNIKLKNGQIVQGELFRTDGTRKQFTIGV
jgi:hypothetical protein